MEDDVLAERILQDLETVFKRKLIFDTFEVIPVDYCLKNKCPIVQVDNHLAIESWCTKDVYKYAYTHLMAWRSGKEKADPSAVLQWTRVILLLCQEIELAWNVRKELIGRELYNLENELNFNALVLSSKPKSSHAFAHRRWILAEIIKILGCLILPDELLEQELNVCKKAASSYAHNYYAWSHRIWVIDKSGLSQEVTQKELQSTEEWIKYHISDHCCFHYRQYLFKEWIQSCLVSKNGETSENDYRQAIVTSLLRELSHNSEQVMHFEGHETLWYHRRFILWTLGRLNCSTMEQVSKRLKYDLQHVIDSEVEFLRKCSEVTECDSWQKVLIGRHLRWVGSVLAVHLPG